jgi:hypothetical protein
MTVFTDKVDVDGKISLYEYGVIRNPKTNKTVICLNAVNDYFYEGIVPKVKVTYISYDDVSEALEEVDDEFYAFIGSTKEIEYNELNNDYLTGIILALNMWNGYFTYQG